MPDISEIDTIEVLVEDTTTVEVVSPAEVVVVEVGLAGPPGRDMTNTDFFQVLSRFAELSTSEAKAAARENLELQNIDGGTFN